MLYITQDIINNYIIEIEIYNQKTMKLNFNNRKIQNFCRTKNLTFIEIKNCDEIYNNKIFRL